MEQDLIKAAEWYCKAAEKGFVDAQANLGMMYYHGQGVSRDLEEAARWLQLAADCGDTESMALLRRINKLRPPDPSRETA